LADRRAAQAVVAVAAAIVLGAASLRIASFDLGYYGDDSFWLALATAVGALALVRSLKLALIAAAVPFGTVQVANAALVLIDLLARHRGWFTAVPAAGFTISLAALVAAGFALWRLRSFADAASAGGEATPASWGPGVAALLAFWLCRLLPLYPDGLVAFRHGGVSGSVVAAVAATAGVSSAALFAFLVLPAALRLMRLDETAIARANRAAERFRNAAARLDFLTQPRWALSASGIAVILFTLAFFDRARGPDGQLHYAVLALWRTQPLPPLGTLIAVLAIGLVWLRAWRLALAVGLASAFAASVYAWLALRIGLTPRLDAAVFDYTPIRSFEMLAPCIALTAGLAFLVAAAIAPDDDFGAALDGRGFTATCIALAAAIACLPTPAVLMPAVALVAALIVLPAFHGAIAALWPRYRSVDEVFGRR
jgi:hypothetical protein